MSIAQNDPRRAIIADLHQRTVILQVFVGRPISAELMVFKTPEMAVKTQAEIAEYAKTAWLCTYHPDERNLRLSVRHFAEVPSVHRVRDYAVFSDVMRQSLVSCDKHGTWTCWCNARGV